MAEQGILHVLHGLMDFRLCQLQADASGGCGQHVALAASLTESAEFDANFGLSVICHCVSQQCPQLAAAVVQLAGGFSEPVIPRTSEKHKCYLKPILLIIWLKCSSVQVRKVCQQSHSGL